MSLRPNWKCECFNDRGREGKRRGRKRKKERRGRRKKRKWEGREEEGSPYPRTGPFFQGGAYKPWVSHHPHGELQWIELAEEA